MRVDFRTHGCEERGMFYSETDRCLIFLSNHETIEDIFCTITHELIHHCIDKHEMIDEIAEDQEEKIIYQMAWATESLI